MIRQIIKGLYYLGKSFREFFGRKTGRLTLPEFLFWEVTDACNSRCSNCNIWKRKPSVDQLTVEEVRRIFSSGFFKNVRDVIISGGEPVLSPDLAEKLLTMFKHIKPDAIVSLSTNALLPDRVLEVAEKCLQAGMNLVVGVSVDGIGKKHDEIRGVAGNFEKADHLLRKLFELKKQYDKLKVIVGYTLSPITVDGMEDVKNYVQSLGMTFLPQMFEEFTYYDLTNTVKNSYREFNADMAGASGKMIRGVNSLSPSFQKEILLKCLRDEPLNYSCASMNKFFVLHCNGDVSPCLRFAHVNAGNIRSGPIWEVWSGDEANKARKLVAGCRGCSNTWATNWSMQYWMPPFVGMLFKSALQKFFAGVIANRLKKK